MSSNLNIRELKYLIIFAIFIKFDYSQAQNSKKNFISVNIAPLLSLYHQNIEIDYEYRISEKISFGTSVGIILPSDCWNGDKEHDVGRKKSRGTILSVEPKYFFKKDVDENHDVVEYFISSQLYCVTHKYQSNRYSDSSMTSIQNYNVKSKILGTNIIFGTMISNKNIFFEMSTGFGFRRINIKNDSKFDIETMSELYRINKYFEPEKDGIYSRCTVLFNFKIGCFF